MVVAESRDVAIVERRIRDAGRAALDDVVPLRLRERVRAEVTADSAAPGVVALAVSGGAEGRRGVNQPAAGVQLIYDGLRLTRAVVAADPWTDGKSEVGDLAILAADVLVARGFYLVANAPAADRAVDVVRQFGRDQSSERSHSSGMEALERSILPLALDVGWSMTDEGPDTEEREQAIEHTRERLATGDGEGFPPLHTVLEAVEGACCGSVEPGAFCVPSASRSSVTE